MAAKDAKQIRIENLEHENSELIAGLDIVLVALAELRTDSANAQRELERLAAWVGDTFNVPSELINSVCAGKQL